MQVSGPSKYVNLFLKDIAQSDPNGKVSDFVQMYKESSTLRGLISTMYPNVTVTVG